MTEEKLLYINLVGLKTLARKETFRIFRIWAQTILPSVVNASLYFMIFGKLIGDRIGLMGGFSYINFIFPGLLLMFVITNSYANTSSSFFSAKFQRSIDELLVSPLSPFTIILGFLSGGLLRAFVVMLAVFITCLFFVDIQIHSPLVVFFTFLLTSLFFSLVGMLNGMVAKNFDAITVIPNFVLTPLVYLGGVFYTVSLLPDFFQKVSMINPILYMINAFRYGFLGVSDVPVYSSLVVLFVLVVVLFFITLWFFKSKNEIRWG